MKIRNTIAIVLIALLGGVGVLAAPRSVQACSCVMLAPGEAGVREVADRVQLVFMGTVEEVSLRTELIRFDVSKVYKGEVGQSVSVGGARDSAACGWVPTVGVEYVVYAHQDNQGRYATTMCNSNHEAPLSDSEVNVFGEGVAPLAGVETEAGWWMRFKTFLADTFMFWR